MYKKQNVFLKILTSVTVFVMLMLAPMYLARISVALNDRIEREKKIVKTVSLTSKSNAGLNLSNKFERIKEDFAEDVITFNEVKTQALENARK